MRAAWGRTDGGANAGCLTPPYLASFAPGHPLTPAPLLGDQIVVASVGDGFQVGCIRDCFESGRLAVAYYSAGLREGWFFVCGGPHLVDELLHRGRDLFPGRWL